MCILPKSIYTKLPTSNASPTVSYYHEVWCLPNCDIVLMISDINGIDELIITLVELFNNTRDRNGSNRIFETLKSYSTIFIRL